MQHNQINQYPRKSLISFLAQDPQSDCIKDAKDLVIAPDPDLFRQEHASQKAAKEKLLQTQHENEQLR